MKNIIRKADGIFAALLVIIYGFVLYGSVALPDEVYLGYHNKAVLGKVYSISSRSEKSVDFQSADSVGSQVGDVKLLGIIPVKPQRIINVSERSVLVSGSSFGIKLYTDGVIIVGTKDISVGGKTVNPAKNAGLEIGDVIISINGEKVYSSDSVEELLNDNNGKPYNIKIKRNDEYKTFTLNPVYVENEGCFKAGMWVRDSTAGIGTITFFNPQSGNVAALGHPITDVDTGELMPILNGEAVETNVTSVIKSTASETGSICCEFLNSKIGALSENTDYGVYGEYSSGADLSHCCEYSVALPQEVQKGFCQIITTVEGSEPQLYSAEITRIYYNDEEKNMVIRITDERLIQKTGGIVQGMSGTPIIQNGKLVGAITHVIVNNPKKGYAIFANTMYELSK